VRIENRYEGANPRRASDVEKLGPDRFLIRPWSEDGDGNYKFCLNVTAVNESGRPETAQLRVDWQDEEYMSCRDYVLVGRDDDWRSVPATIEGTVAVATVPVPPGEWYIGLHPVYDAERLAADRQTAVAGGFEERVYGRSRSGRELVALEIGPQEKPAILVLARFHPYETAGSHCVSAIVELLAGDAAEDGKLSGAFRFVLVPVTNPDGAAAGCCKRSRQDGPDLCHEGADSDDAAGAALARLLDELHPEGYLDLHGWMYRDHDGLSYANQAERDAFVAALAGKKLFSKEWKGSFSGDRPRKPGDFCSRAFHDHRAVSFIISPSWFGRTVPEMRDFGREVLRAFCGVVG